MTKLEFPNTPFSLSRLPHWLAPVVFAFSVIAIISVLLIIIAFIAKAVSDASLVVDPPTPDSILDTKKLSRIGPRIGLDGISVPDGALEAVEPVLELEPDIEPNDTPESAQDEVLVEEADEATPDNLPIEAPIESPQ